MIIHLPISFDKTVRRFDTYRQTGAAHVRWISSLIVAAGLFLWGAQAFASGPCPEMERRLDQLEVVVSARVLAWPVPRLMILEVDRYYKGEGPRILVVEKPGWIGSNWYSGLKNQLLGRRPTAEPDLVGFAFHRGRGSQLINSGCDDIFPIFRNEATSPWLKNFAEGKPPEEGIGIRSHFVWDFPLKVGLLSGVWIWWRRRRARRRAVTPH